VSTRKKCRIICVEDDVLVSMLIEDMLLDLGIEVVGRAYDLDDALALARGSATDAAVLDINIGGRLAYPVADVLRARRIPFIFCTGYPALVLPERFWKTPLLEKPFGKQQLAEILQFALADRSCEISAA
jgi:CheY-like chemotaxis protein